MDGNDWLEEIKSLYRQYKKNCERAAAQVSDDDFVTSFGQSPHSIAVLMKHVECNHRSRRRDFLTTDGEKRDRNRESEFIADSESRSSIHKKWQEGWRIAFETLESLEPADLEKTITIRGQTTFCCAGNSTQPEPRGLPHRANRPVGTPLHRRRLADA